MNVKVLLACKIKGEFFLSVGVSIVGKEVFEVDFAEGSRLSLCIWVNIL